MNEWKNTKIISITNPTSVKVIEEDFRTKKTDENQNLIINNSSIATNTYVLLSNTDNNTEKVEHRRLVEKRDKRNKENERLAILKLGKEFRAKVDAELTKWRNFRKNRYSTANKKFNRIFKNKTVGLTSRREGR